jgi:hypothetical protein
MNASSQILCATLLALVSCGGSAFFAQAAGTSLDRELEEYATAACLIAQKDDEYLKDADSDDLARVFRFDLAQDSEMISPSIPI